MTGGEGTNEHREPCSVLHVFSGDLWAGAEVMTGTLLRQLALAPSLKVMALALNEGILTKKLRAAGIPVTVIPEAEHSMLQIVRKARRIFDRERVRIIHTHRYKENVLGWLLGQTWKGIHLVATLHGLPENATVQAGRSWKAALANFVNVVLLRYGFTRVVVVSHDMKHVLTQAGTFLPQQLRVIHNGIAVPKDPADRLYITSEKPHGTVRIGTVCRLVPVKGLDLFLESAAAVRDRYPQARFAILGEGPLREELERRTKTLGIQSQIEWFAPREDPFPFYRSLDLYLNTSMHEGIPCSILEAMSVGLPVVAPRVGGIPEIVTDRETGLLVQERTGEAFAQAIMSLLDDSATRLKMGERGRQTILSQFGETSMAESYQALYRECLIR